jgi:hypothetical protein
MKLILLASNNSTRALYNVHKWVPFKPKTFGYRAELTDALTMNNKFFITFFWELRQLNQRTDDQIVARHTGIAKKQTWLCHTFLWRIKPGWWMVFLLRAQAWKPIDFGHPLVDPTLHYAPPALERVHIGPGPPPSPAVKHKRWGAHDTATDDDTKYHLDVISLLNESRILLTLHGSWPGLR